MKRAFLSFLLMLLSGFACATPDYSDAFFMNTELRNFGTDNCTLVKKMLVRGRVVDRDIPSILAATGELYSFMLKGNVIDVYLNYQCGEYKKFTLHMSQHRKKGYKHATIYAEMINAVDVFEKHQMNLTDHRCPDHPGVIRWQIFQ